MLSTLKKAKMQEDEEGLQAFIGAVQMDRYTKLGDEDKTLGISGEWTVARKVKYLTNHWKRGFLVFWEAM